MTPIPYECINDSKLHEGMRLAELSTSRRPSSISFECHSAQIFEEISAELDKLDLDDEDDDDTYGETNGTDDDGSDNYVGPNGTTSLETILKDKTICPTHRYEARVVNNAMRRGNSMLLRRCSSDIMSGIRRTPSFIDQVISSVSAELRASGRFRDGVVTPVIVERKNDTFSDTADGGNSPNNNGEQNASASRAGRSLLGSKRPRRELCTNSNRSIGGRGTNQPNSSLEPNSFGSLRGTDFLELMNMKSRS